MSYRDDLTAALARIAVLEAELAEARGETVDAGRLRDERDELSGRYQRLHERAQTELDGMPTSIEHNRARPPLVLTEATGVMCPRCHVLGERVELYFIGELVNGVRLARCPRCAASELLMI